MKIPGLGNFGTGTMGTDLGWDCCRPASKHERGLPNPIPVNEESERNKNTSLIWHVYYQIILVYLQILAICT